MPHEDTIAPGPDDATREIHAAFLDTNRLPDNEAIRETRDAAKALLKSSRRIEFLTVVLVGLTIVLALLTWRLALR